MADVKISALPNAITLTGIELIPIVQSGQTVQTTAQDVANLNSLGVKQWIAYVTQLGTDAPTISGTIKNDFSGDITFTYFGAGTYGLLNSLPEFTVDKSIVLFTPNGSQSGTMGGNFSGTTELVFVSFNTSGTPTDNQMSNGTLLIINVYP